MLVNRVSQSYIPFKRKLKEEEKPEYKKAIQDSYDFLGVDKVSMILHGSSYPSLGKDIGTGSPYSKAANNLIEFEKLHGFNSIQQGPPGKISKGDFSPYTSQVWGRNQLFIDLDKLQTKEYANILDDKTKKIAESDNSIKGKNYSYSNFSESFQNINFVIRKSYSNFKDKLKNKDEDAIRLNNEFSAYKDKNKKWLEKESLFKILSGVHGTEDFSLWENETDKNLPTLLNNNDEKAITRYEKIKSRSGEKIEQNKFAQFIADKQIKEHRQTRNDKDFEYISDLLVGYSKSDVWANKDAFLEGWSMGCPYGGENNGIQTWGIPVLDPNKLFNEDNSLGVAGQVLKDKLLTLTDDFENIRVDHALGLVDPYIYKESAPNYKERYNENSNNISKLSGMDLKGNYKKIIEKIVLPTLTENGVNPKDAVWEDLVTPTDVFTEVYNEKLNLPGITQTLFSRGENKSRDNWFLLGSHDNKPAHIALKEDRWLKDDDSWNKDYLGGFLNAGPDRTKERQEFINKIDKNPRKKLEAKFAELFVTGKKIQISFADFFGLNKTYNVAGQNVSTNWKLRLNNDYEDAYHKNLESRNPTAINMPKILQLAVQAKRDMLLAKAADKNVSDLDYRKENIDAKIKPLMNKLAKFEKILKEPEPKS